MSDINAGVVDSLKVLDPNGRLEKRTCVALRVTSKTALHKVDPAVDSRPN